MNHERIDDKTFLVEIVDKVSNDTAQEKCVIVAITILFWDWHMLSSSKSKRGLNK